MEHRQNRPASVTTVAALELLTGIGGLVLGTLLVAASQMPSTLILFPSLSDLSAQNAMSFLFVIGVVLTILGILDLLAGMKSLGGRSWAWLLGMGANGVLVIISFMWLFAVSTLTGIPGLLVSTLIVYFLKRPDVRQFFGRQ